MAKHEQGSMDKHEHGAMDITEQTRTFEGFLRVAALTVVAAVAVLLLLTFRI